MTTTALDSSRAERAAARTPRWWWALAVFAALIVLYALAYVVVGPPMYPPNLAASFRARPWGIYPHALFGALALGTGAAQLHPGLLVRRRALHRTLGTVYVASCAVVGLAGLYMAAYAAGGAVPRAGFGLLAVLLLATTGAAYRTARRREIRAHRAWMLRSFALIFAAVTLRIELPLLVAAFRGEFTPAYQVVAWLCWVPNLAFAEWRVRRSRRAPALLRALGAA
jgi:uncharacterized membrane protein